MPVEAAGRRPGNCHAPQPGDGAAHGLKAAVQSRASSEGALLGAPRADSGNGAGQERSQSGGGLGTTFPKQGFPAGSAGKESACNAGDPSLITGLGRSPGGGDQSSCSVMSDSLRPHVLQHARPPCP